MTDRELRKLSRAELMQMLLEQSREIELLRKQLDAAQAALETRMIHTLEAGTMAEAALKLNGVFEAADAACKEYLENIKKLNREMEMMHEKAQP